MRTVAVVCAIAASAFIVPLVRAGLVGVQYEHNPYLVHDQWQTGSDISYGVGGPTMLAQTFTAGQTGILDHIDIGNLTGVTYYPVSARPVVQIQEGSPLDWTSLASVTLSNPLLLDHWTLCIEPLNAAGEKISVNAGTVYSIVLWGGGVPDATVGATISDSYDAGELWAWGDWDVNLQTPDTWGQLYRSGVWDMQFQTYVVPLPAGVWLGICAVSVAGWHLKRQRA